jgi:predicted dehydrogenase
MLMDDKRIRIGVIGTGGMGSSHCAVMGDVQEAVLGAVCDIVPAVAEEIGRKHEVPSFERADDLLDSGLVDAVIIATPHYDHTPIAIQAFERGIHVLSEKPIAVCVSDADRMIQAAAESGRKFAVMFQMRSLGRALAARKVIEEGRLGEIYRTSLVMGWFRTQAYYDSGGWRATWAGEGGGVLINQAPHFLDLFCWLAGLPSRVTGRTRTRLHDIEVEDEGFAFLDYPNGAHGYLYASTTESPQHEMMEICGDKGKLVMHGSNLRFLQNHPTVREFAHESGEMWSKPEVEDVPL